MKMNTPRSVRNLRQVPVGISEIYTLTHTVCDSADSPVSVKRCVPEPDLVAETVKDT
jgi:hypothetical protein